MKKNRFLLIVLALLMLIPTGAFAKRGSKGSGGIMIQGGLDLGLNLPMLSMYEKGCESKVLFDDNTDYTISTWQRTVWVQFGGKIGGNFGLSYVTKKNRGFGFMLNVAYNFGGGIHGYTGKRAAGLTTESIGEDIKQVIFSHSIIADINFSFKSKMDKTANFAAELGLRLMPTFDHTFLMNNDWTEKLPNDLEYPEAKHWYFFIGPNVFLGADVRVGDNFMITPGFRFAATFADDPDQTYDDRRDFRRCKFRTKLMFAFEIKLNGYYKK